MAQEIAKAGWLQRQSTILRRWKREWFVLYQDGDLRYFESPNSHEPEARIVVRAVCKCIQAGAMVDVIPPEGKSKDCLLNLVIKDGDLKLCAEDPDDMRAWQIALEEARIINRPPPQQGLPPPYPGTVVYPRQEVVPTHYPIRVGGPSSVVYCANNGYPGQVISAPYGQPGTQVVYVNQDPYYRYNRYDGSDVAMGVVAGAAIGSMMWGPLWW